MTTFHELSLFSGLGGSLLGTQLLLNFETVGYVEIDEYRQKILRRRIDDGVFSDAPIYGDINTFNSEGYAGAYTGMVDVVTAGFPSNPLTDTDDLRREYNSQNLWPATYDTIRIVGSPIVFLESSPSIITSGYLPVILSDLAECGYDARWMVLPAYLGSAPCIGRRLWIMAQTRGKRLEGIQPLQEFIHLQPIEIPVPGDLWHPEPLVHRTTDGDTLWMERVKSIGDTTPPGMVAEAWKILAGVSSKYFTEG